MESQGRFVSPHNISGSSKQNTVAINLGLVSIWNLGLHQTIEPFIHLFIYFGCFLTFLLKKKSPIYFSCLGEGCLAVLLRKCFVDLETSADFLSA